ncbi:uncharacterized protein LOC120429162 [Culex pipiens pallens]|uniref:uncharacterized protein LOC120429162 n=1 Tax=Culex pipiens pallens TaxID=42434 RepID=UPI0019537291|nr:uncharacterized protein LOC120429162 [Culex pipiens pallens]
MFLREFIPANELRKELPDKPTGPRAQIFREVPGAGNFDRWENSGWILLCCGRAFLTRAGNCCSTWWFGCDLAELRRTGSGNFEPRLDFEVRCPFHLWSTSKSWQGPGTWSILVQHGSQWSEDKKTRWRLVARIVVLWIRRRSVSTGSAVWLAHRDQLKPHYQQQGERPNLMTPFEKSTPGAAMVDVDVEMLNLDENMLGTGYGGSGLFRGFPEPVSTGSKRRKRDAGTAKLPDSYPRRSKRLRKPAKNSEFVYS